MRRKQLIIERKYNHLNSIIQENINKGIAPNPQLLIEFELFSKLKKAVDKVIDKGKAGIRKLDNATQDLLSNITDPGNMTKIIKQMDLEDAEVGVLEDFVEKLGEEAKKFLDLIKQLADDARSFNFPNTDGEMAQKARQKYGIPETETDVVVFNHMINGFVQTYDAIVGAHEKGSLTTNDANDLIARIRELFNTYSKKLDRAYLKLEDASKNKPIIDFNHIHKNKLSTLLFEAEAGDKGAEYRAQIRRERGTAIGSDSETEEMKQNRGYGIILKGALAGALLGSGIGALVNAGKLKDIWNSVGEAKFSETTFKKVAIDGSEETVSSLAQELVVDGEGLTQTLQRATGIDLGPSAKPDNLVQALKRLGGGNAQQGIENLVTSTDGSGLFGGGGTARAQQAKKILEMFVDGSISDKGSNLGQILKGNLAGTGKSIYDQLTVFKGTDYAATTLTTIKNNPIVLKIMQGKKLIRPGVTVGMAANNVLNTLAPWALGYAAAGTAVAALLRYNSLKNSRAAKIDQTIKEFEDVEEKEGGIVVPPPVPPVDPPVPPVDPSDPPEDPSDPPEDDDDKEDDDDRFDIGSFEPIKKKALEKVIDAVKKKNFNKKKKEKLLKALVKVLNDKWKKKLKKAGVKDADVKLVENLEAQDKNLLQERWLKMAGLL